MASLYEIDQAILDCIDFETGEIVDQEKLNELQMARDEKIEKVALWYKNLLADAEVFKAEKQAFEERQKVATNKAESLKKWLTNALNGSKFSTARVAVSFRKSEQVEVDEAAFMDYAQKCNRDDLLTFKEPTPNKTAIKAAIKGGQNVFGAALVEKNNIQIK